MAPVKLSHLGVKNLINLLMLEKGLPSILYYIMTNFNFSFTVAFDFKNGNE